jgi:hypothetical protein
MGIGLAGKYGIHEWESENYGISCPYCSSSGPCSHLLGTWSDSAGWLNEPSGTEFFVPATELLCWFEKHSDKPQAWYAAKLGPLASLVKNWLVNDAVVVSCDDFERICHILHVPVLMVYRELDDPDLIPQSDLVVFFSSYGGEAHTRIQRAWTKMEIEVGSVWTKEPAKAHKVPQSLRWKGRGTNGEYPPSGTYLFQLISRWASQVRGDKVPEGTWEFLRWAMEGRVINVLNEMANSGISEFQDAARTVRQLEPALERGWSVGPPPWLFLRTEIRQGRFAPQYSRAKT